MQTTCAEAAEVAGETGLGALDLAPLGLAAQLRDDLVDVGDAGGSHRVPLRLQAARGVDRSSPPILVTPRSSALWPSPFLKKPHSSLSRFQDGEGVVQLGHVDLGRLHLRHLETPSARHAHGHRSVGFSRSCTASVSVPWPVPATLIIGFLSFLATSAETSSTAAAPSETGQTSKKCCGSAMGGLLVAASLPSLDPSW
jgi:hypothetical protein